MELFKTFLFSFSSLEHKEVQRFCFKRVVTRYLEDLFSLDTFLLIHYYNHLPMDQHTQDWCITHLPLDRLFSVVTFTSLSIFKVIIKSSYKNLFRIQGKSHTDLTSMKTLLIIFPYYSLILYTVGSVERYLFCKMHFIVAVLFISFKGQVCRLVYFWKTLIKGNCGAFQTSSEEERLFSITCILFIIFKFTFYNKKKARRKKVGTSDLLQEDWTIITPQIVHISVRDAWFPIIDFCWWSNTSHTGTHYLYL